MVVAEMKAFAANVLRKLTRLFHEGCSMLTAVCELTSGQMSGTVAV